MANTVIAASLTLDSNQATQSVKSFRAQLKDATNDLQQIQAKFGATSAEAIAAAKGVAELRDRIKEAKEVSEVFNPDAKFEAVTKFAASAASGVTALTGAMALFGSESEDVQKALLKVQAALALSQGLSGLGEIARNFELVKVAATDAFLAIKAGIGSTGIGLLVIALGAIVAYWDDIKVAIGGASSAQLKSLDITTKQLEYEKQKLEIITSQQNIYKEQGKTQNEILAIENKQLDLAISKAEAQLEAQKRISDQAIRAAAKIVGINGTANPAGLLAKMIFGDLPTVAAEQAKITQEMQAGLTKMLDRKAAIDAETIKNTSDFNQQINTLNHDAAEAGITDAYQLSQRKLKDALESQKEQYTIEYTNVQQRNALIGAAEQKYNAESTALAKKYAKDKADAINEATYQSYIANIQNQTLLQELAIKHQLAKDTEAANLEISNLKDRNAKILAITKEADAKISALRNKDLLDFQVKWTESLDKSAQEDADNFVKFVDDFTSKQENALAKGKDTLLAENLNLNKEIADMNLDAAGQQAAASMAQLNKWYDEKQKALKGNADAELALTKEYERQKTQITEIENNSRLSIIANVLGQAADLFGKATVAGKALAIAQTTIDTYQSATASYKALAGIPVVGPALGFAAAAVAIAAGLANVKKILSVQIPGASGGVSGGGALSAPLQPQPVRTSTQLPQDQINAIGNSTVRAFIVESDIKDAGERTTRLNRQARLGGV